MKEFTHTVATKTIEDSRGVIESCVVAQYIRTSWPEEPISEMMLPGTYREIAIPTPTGDGYDADVHAD